MMCTTIRKIAIAAVLCTAFVPRLAGAVVPTAPPSSVVSTSLSPIDAVVALLEKLGGWFWGIISALAAVFIVYAAFLYLTSGGDEEKVKTAKKYIVYAIIYRGCNRTFSARYCVSRCHSILRTTLYLI